MIGRLKQLTAIPFAWSTVRVQTTSYAPENAEQFLTQATLEGEMFTANLEYREALAELKALMRER